MKAMLLLFLEKVAVELALKWHDTRSHDRAERYREILKEIDNAKAKSAGVDSGK
jgi:hypothetical protein